MTRNVLGRTVTTLLCVLGLSSLPVVAAPLTVSSGDLSVYRSCTLTVRGSSAVEGYDAWVQQDKLTSNNNNNDQEVDSALLKNRRSYLAFDLTKCIPQIPASATVTSAVLRLYLSVRPNACRTHDIFRVGSAWSESTLTWGNQPFGILANNPPSGERTASIDVGAAPCQNDSTGTYVTPGWDVTTDVAAFVAGTATNHGWMIRDDVEDSLSARTAAYKSKNANNAVQSPQLIINYR